MSKLSVDRNISENRVSRQGTNIPQKKSESLIPQLHLGEFGNYNEITWKSAITCTRVAYHNEIMKNKGKDRYDVFKKYEIHALWHFCHISNIQSILQYGLFSKNGLRASHIGFKVLQFGNVSDDEIQKRRKQKGCHDYVPLYFASSPPMVCRIQIEQKKKNIVCLELDPNLLYLNKCIFSDKNVGGKYDCMISGNLDDLKHLRWKLIHLEPGISSKYDSSEAKHLRGAEALVKYVIPPSFIKRIHVYSDETQRLVEDMADAANKSIEVVQSMENRGVNTNKILKKE